MRYLRTAFAFLIVATIVIVGITLDGCAPQQAVNVNDAGGDATASDETSEDIATGVADLTTRLLRKMQRAQRGPSDAGQGPDLRTPAQINIAACTAADGSWRCEGHGPLKAAGVRPPYPPYSWSVGTLYLDPSNVSGTASDTNNCTTTSTACLHWYEITQRWGTYSPILAQNTTITWLSSQPVGAVDAGTANGQNDPIIFTPIIRNASLIQFLGVLNATTQVSAGTITVNHAKSRAGKQLLDVSFSGTANAENLILNTTHVSRSTSDYTSVGNLMMQPLSGTTTIALPAEVDTWTTGDSYIAYATVNLNVVTLYPTVTDDGSAATAVPMLVDGITILGQSSLGTLPWNDTALIDGPLIFADSVNYKKTLTTVSQAGQYPATRFVNDVLFGNASISGNAPTWQSGGGPIQNGDSQNLYHVIPAIFGGMFIDDNTTYEDQFQNVWIDGDVQFQTGGIGASFSGVNFFGCLNIRSGGAIRTINAYMYPVTDICATPSIYVGAAGSGSYHIRPDGASRWAYGGGSLALSATSVFLAGGVLHLNASVITGCSHNNATPDVVNCGITVNVTNLDAAQGVAGFGGFAYLPAGASYSSTY